MRLKEGLAKRPDQFRFLFEGMLYLQNISNPTQSLVEKALPYLNVKHIERMMGLCKIAGNNSNCILKPPRSELCHISYRKT